MPAVSMFQNKGEVLTLDILLGSWSHSISVIEKGKTVPFMIIFAWQMRIKNQRSQNIRGLTEKVKA